MQTTNAPVWRRFLAIVYDILSLGAVLFAATLVVVIANRGAAVEPANLLFSLYLLLVSGMYFVWCWVRGGQTLGMRSWQLYLRRRDDSPLTWSLAIARYVLAILSWIPFGLGYLWCFVNSEKLAWHDLATETKLVFISDRGPRS